MKLSLQDVHFYGNQKVVFPILGSNLKIIFLREWVQSQFCVLFVNDFAKYTVEIKRNVPKVHGNACKKNGTNFNFFQQKSKNSKKKCGKRNHTCTKDCNYTYWC